MQTSSEIDGLSMQDGRRNLTVPNALAMPARAGRDRSAHPRCGTLSGREPRLVGRPCHEHRMSERPFSPGFRLSTIDVIVLIVGAGAATALARVDGWIALAVAFVVAHFFLFCNVLRMSRPLELIWAGTFASLAAATMTIGVPSWWMVFARSLVLTIVLAVIQMRRRSYLGVGWRRLNPDLPEWWRTQQRHV